MRRLERKKEKNRGKNIVALKIQKISLKAEMCSSEVLLTNQPYCKIPDQVDKIVHIVR